MLGWFGDLGRLSWGLLYWNARKSLFRIRGAAGAAPCQHPSDSGEAGKTGCEACRGWSDRRRFRRLCPLISVGAGGRALCSVSARQVRPFWGRAIAWLGGALAAILIFSVLGAFVALRAVGYRVPLRVVAWPPAWHRIQAARADYYLDMGLRALRAGDAHKGFLALSHAYMLDPGNLAAARLLGQVTQVANPDYSDEIYSQLLLGHGRDFEDTAEVWFRALLARGDFKTVASLSARMLREGAVHVPAWTQGLIFAERMGATPAEIDGLLSAKARIPDEARSVLSLAAAMRGGSATERMRRLEVSLGGGSTAFEVYYSLRQLSELGRAADVVKFLEGPEGAALLSYDREALKLDAYSILGWGAVERREISALLDQGGVGPVVTLVSAHLVRHPSAEAAQLTFRLLDARPLPATPANVGGHMALLCMAGANGMDQRMGSEARVLAGLVGGTAASWDKVRESLAGPARSRNPAEFLPLLSEMPLEVEYALISRHHDAAAQQRAASDQRSWP
jgi:hypothetical protein